MNLNADTYTSPSSPKRTIVESTFHYPPLLDVSKRGRQFYVIGRMTWKSKQTNKRLLSEKKLKDFLKCVKWLSFSRKVKFTLLISSVLPIVVTTVEFISILGEIQLMLMYQTIHSKNFLISSKIFGSELSKHGHNFVA